MKKILISDGKLEVTNVCLGAMNFGTTTDKKSAYEVLDAYIERGGNFIDTSNNYAHWAGTGDESETLLGEWLRDRKCRDKVVIATKVGFDRHGEGAGLKREQIEYWCDQSLKKLGTDYIDLYYAHVDDPSTPLEETMEAFNSLVKKGKVRVLGGSNYDTWRFHEANLIARDKELTPYSVMQQRFSYLYTRGDVAPKYPFNEYVNRERLRYLAKQNMPLVAYSCLLKGGYESPERMPAENITGERLEALRKMAAEKGVSATALAVAWMTNLDRVEGFPTVIPLFASSKVAHFTENLDGAEINLTDDELEILCKA